MYFEPFLDNKELAFCIWEPQGQTLSESVPGLYDIVGRRKDWRAIIINSGSDEQLKKQNPFDAVDYSSVLALPKPSPQPLNDEALDDWEESWRNYFSTVTPMKEQIYVDALSLPLQKLATWLCFHPTDYIMDDVAEKQDVFDWALERIDTACGKANAFLEELERAQYRRELRMKETLRNGLIANLNINIARPAEVYCISERIDINGFFHPDAFWTIRSDVDYSEFVDRNMYFDKMRFAVCDILPRTHRNYRCNRIRFLYTLLVFASNPIPRSALQPRKLYLLESENDDTPLCVLATSYDRKLAATFERLDHEMEQIRSEIPGELTDKEAEALFCTSAEVTVPLDRSCDTDALQAENSPGLSSDCPENEERSWSESYAASKKALEYIIRQQARSVKKSVEKLRANSEVTDRNISRLTSFQMSDIRDYTELSEDEMVASIPTGGLAKLDDYTERMEKRAEGVNKVMEQRMSRKTTVCLGAVCLGVLLLCCLPLLFGNGGTAGTVTTALLLIVGMLGVLAVILLIKLFFLRQPLSQAIRLFNDEMTAILNDIKGSLQDVSKYLSQVCNVSRGYTVLNYAEHNVDDYEKRLRIRKKHQADIRKLRAYLEEDYGDFIGNGELADPALIQPYDYDFDQQTEYAYPAPFVAGDCRQIEFLESGNLVTVPSGYVTRIQIRMEEIYDK